MGDDSDGLDGVDIDNGLEAAVHIVRDPDDV